MPENTVTNANKEPEPEPRRVIIIGPSGEEEETEDVVGTRDVVVLFV
jgi:hypothetical protein